jgi:uncharacterized SAM-dependent methyltransferase
MNSYSNADIARKFNVSRSTVTAWVQSAEKGKNNLQLTNTNKKVQVIKNEHNEEELKRLTSEGKKFKSKSDYEEVVVKDEFYKIFNEKQVIEIINTLKTNREINMKYTYFNGGSKMWDDVCIKALEKGTYAALNNTPKMLADVVDFLSRKTSDFAKINIIDIAQGNAFPTKDFIQNFYDLDLLNSYIAVDISKEMNEICEKNINKWFPKLKFKSYVRDLELDNIADICFNNKESEEVINIIVFVGDTIGNFRDQDIVLKNIKNSLDDEDILVVGNKLGTYVNKATLGHVEVKNPIHLIVPNLLGIDTQACGTSFRFDEQTGYRTGSLVLDKNYTIVFKQQKRKIEIDLQKGEELIVWVHNMWEIPQVVSDLNTAGLELTQLTTTKNLTHVLVICQNQHSFKVQ